MSHKYSPLLVAVLICIAGNVHARQSIHTAFSPSPGAIALVVSTIKSANRTIHLAAYSFTSDKVTQALIEEHMSGVQIFVVVDKSQAKKPRKAILDLCKAGVPIRVNHKYAIMHNKYMVIDDKTIETGSFNYTVNAEKHNAENVIVVYDNARLAKKYQKDWERLWDESNPFICP